MNVRFDTRKGAVIWVTPTMVQMVSETDKDHTTINLLHGLSVTLDGLTADYVSAQLRTDPPSSSSE